MRVLALSPDFGFRAVTQPRAVDTESLVHPPGARLGGQPWALGLNLVEVEEGEAVIKFRG